MTTPTILQACDDAELFGFELYPRQRELLAALEAGPRIAVWALGRRSGKTTLAALAALHSCLFRPDLDAMVRRGERRYAVGVATNQSQARLLVQAARSVIEASPLLASLVCSDNEDSIGFALPSGARTELRAFPCNSRGGRGWPVGFLVMDEAAHFLSEADGWQAAERVFSALIPATAQFGTAARVVVSSTPYGSDGFFARLYQQAVSGELADAAAHHAATADVNPTIDAAFLAAEQARDPDSFAAEYLGQFRGSGAAYLDFGRFEASDRGELPPEAGHGWVVGLDPAFSSDPFGLAVVGRSADGSGRLVVAQVRAWRPRRAASFEEKRVVEDELMDQVIACCRRFGASAVTDQHAARAVVDRLMLAGVPVQVNAMNAATKTAAFGELRARLYDGTLELYDEPALMAELRRLRSKFTAGTAAVVNPRVGGSHGDMAQALALAVQAHAQLGPMVGRLPAGGGRTMLGDVREARL
jgi:phage terminase large subunit-like protein